MFRLPTYAVAADNLVIKTVREIARAKEPLLQDFQVREVSSVMSHRLTAPSGEVVETPPTQISMNISFDISDAIRGDFDALYVAMDEAAEKLRSRMGGATLTHIDRVAEAFGQVVDGGGQPLSHDLLLDALDK